MEIEQSIPDRFRSQVRTHGDRLAVKFGVRAHSYKNLDRLSTQISHAIFNRRGDNEEPVLILLDQGDQLVSAILGALKAGKIYVPQNPASGVSTIRRIVQDCGAPLIVTDAHNREMALQVTGHDGNVLDVSRLPNDLPTTDLEIELGPERTAYIYYTSGSTGTPKGVVDCHRNILHNIMRYTNSLNIGPEDRLSLLQLPAFSGAVSSMFCALLNGASLFPFDLAGSGSSKMADWVIAERLTMFHSIPVVFEQLMAARRQFTSLRVIRLEGDKAKPKHLHLFRDRFDMDCWLVNGLGATETGLTRQFFFNPAMPFNEDDVPIGYPVEDMDILLLDEDNSPVGDGHVGEIAVKSQYIALGYWRHKQLGEMALSESPKDCSLRLYRTGDLGKFGPNNCLYHLGRKHYEIRIGGQRIDPSAVEAALLACPPIRDVVVATHAGIHGRQQLVAYIVVPDRGALEVDTLRLALAKILPPVAIPGKYVFVDSLPLDSNLKLDRRKLPAPGNTRPKLRTALKAPETPLEKTLINGFKQVLNIDTIGINDDFYDLGGDSLAAVELALFLEETLAIAIPSELFFGSFSVEKIMKWRQGTESSPTIITLRKGGDLPPLFLFHDFAGHVLDYVYLADALKDPRPVYGIQRCGTPETTIDPLLLPELTERYVKQIRRIQPDGPYLLGGQCFGGLLAFEAAHQLRRSGNEVQCVILMDTAFPGFWPRRVVQRMSPRRHWRKMAGLSAPLKARYVAMRTRNILRSAATTIERNFRWQLGLKNKYPRGLSRALQRPTDAHRLAEAKYRAMDYEGAVILICAGPIHNQRGWESVVVNSLTTFELSITEESGYFSHPTAPAYIFELVKVLDQVLANCN
jgi:amino acid adenylation domain-containing protein